MVSGIKSGTADPALEQPLLAAPIERDAVETQSASSSTKDTEHHRCRSQHSGNKQCAKNLVAELQVETLSTACALFFLYSWYAMLILALVLQSFVTLQWQMTNICNAATENLNHFDQWNSSCVVKEMHRSTVDWNMYGTGKQRFSVPMGSLTSRVEADPSRSSSGDTRGQHTYDLRWVGTPHGGLLDVRLNRFAQVVLSMASPSAFFPEGVEVRQYQLMVALEESPLVIPIDTADSSSLASMSSSTEASSSSGSGRGTPSQVYVYNTTTTCRRTVSRCSSVVLPQDVAVRNNESRITLTIFNVEEELANVSENSAVGIVFQKSGYTIGTIVWRYTFMFISIIQLVRFLYRKRFSKALYEQYWVMLLHLGLFLYLDPLFAAGIYESRGAAVYHFFEFYIPSCFAALLVCFVFAVIIASMNWGEDGRSSENAGVKKIFSFSAEFPPVEDNKVDSGDASYPPTPRQNQSDTAAVPVVSRRTSDTFDEFVRNTHATRHSVPVWANVTCAVFFLCVLALVIGQLLLRDMNESAAVGCTGFLCVYILYAIYSLLLVGILVCSVLLFWLHRNLGRRPYLESRPQQLACRVFIFVFTTAFIYFVVQVILIIILYPDIVGIVSYQPFTQLSPVMVSTFFVNHITFVYTTTVASRRVPIRPDNPRWRRVVWSPEWYRWLDNHGGILYIFHSERQERHFNYIQNRERMATVGKQRGHTKRFASPSISAVRENTAQVDGVNKVSDLYGTAGDQIPNNETHESSGFSESSEVTEEEIFLSGESATLAAESEGKSNVLQWAERQLIDRPAALIDRLEDALIDPLHSLLVRGRGRMQFFNLETAIDCLNLSWEAYAVTERCDEVEATPGTEVDPHTFPPGAAGAIRRVLCWVSKTKRTAEDGDNTHSKTDGAGESGGLTLGTDATSCVAGAPNPMMDTEKYGYKRIAVFEARAVQVVVAVMDTTCSCHHGKLPRLVIAFRGTDNLSNAREDIRFRKRVWREMENRHMWKIGQRAKVHTGFLDTWVTLKERVLGTIRTHLERHSHVVYSLFFTGHSLGGALAALCAYSVRRMLRLMQYPMPELTVYTFGEPPFGNKSFQKSYNKAIPRHFRVVNESDAVSFFSLFGGSHIGIEVDIDRHGNYICMPMFIERLFHPTQGKGFAVANHTLAAYAQSLNAVANCNAGSSCRVRCLQPYLPEEKNANHGILE